MPVDRSLLGTPPRAPSNEHPSPFLAASLASFSISFSSSLLLLLPLLSLHGGDDENQLLPLISFLIRPTQADPPTPSWPRQHLPVFLLPCLVTASKLSLFFSSPRNICFASFPADRSAHLHTQSPAYTAYSIPLLFLPSK